MRRCLVALAVLAVLASCSAEPGPLAIASRASSDTIGLGTVSWRVETPASAPPKRLRMASAYQGAGTVLLFGGDDVAPLGDTWLWDGVTWRQPKAAAAPDPRTGHAMAFDAARGKVILFGGVDGTGAVRSDTWAWDGAAWSLLSPTTSPAPRQRHAMAYDARRGKIVLFGGCTDCAAQTLAETWEWDGTLWTLRTNQSPGGDVMAYDSARSVTVLFAGTRAGGATSASLWTTWAMCCASRGIWRERWSRIGSRWG